MRDRVDDELRRVTTALAEVSPPKPEVAPSAPAIRSPVLVAVAAFVLVLGVGLTAGLLFDSGPNGASTVESTAPAPSTVPAAPAGVPDDHLAARLLAEGAGYEELSEVSRQCARGGGPTGPFAMCLVDDDGTLVLVPLLIAANVEAVISGSAIDGEIRIELPAVTSEGSLPALEDLVPISHTGGTVDVRLWYNGEASSGGMSGFLEPPEAQAGTIPVPGDHLARQVVAADLTFEEVPEFVLERGAEALWSQGGGATVCVVWENGVAVFIPFALPEGIQTEVSSPSVDDRLEIALEVGELVAVPFEFGRFLVIHRIPGEVGTRSYSTDFPSQP